MIRVASVAFAGTLLAGCSLFGIRSGYDELSYTTVGRIAEDVEIRGYGPRLAAEAVVPAADREDGQNGAFRLLFDYISGANRPRAEIAMTVPVATGARHETIAMTAPVETTPAGGGQMAMRFFLPTTYSMENAPQPTDVRVRLVKLPEQTMAVLRFSGLGGEESVAEKTRDLLAALDESAWKPAGEPFTMYYDPPWTIPFLRRNEVAVAVAPK